MNFDAITGNKAFQLTRETVNNFLEDSALRLSAALAYYSVFSIAPLLVIAISIAGLVLGAESGRSRRHAEPVTAAERAQEGLEPSLKKDDSTSSEIRTVRVQEPMPFRVENALLLAATVGVLAGLVTRSTHHAGD